MSDNLKDKPPYFCGNNHNWPKGIKVAKARTFTETTKKPSPEEKKKITGAGW